MNINQLLRLLRPFLYRRGKGQKWALLAIGLLVCLPSTVAVSVKLPGSAPMGIAVRPRSKEMSELPESPWWISTAIEFEPGLKQDFPSILDRLFPMDEDWEHHKTWGDHNGGSHLQASTLGMDFSCPLSDGRLNLGTWQQVIHLECDDKPRRREVVVTIIGE